MVEIAHNGRRFVHFRRRRVKRYLFDVCRRFFLIQNGLDELAQLSLVVVVLRGERRVYHKAVGSPHKVFAIFLVIGNLGVHLLVDYHEIPQEAPSELGFKHVLLKQRFRRDDVQPRALFVEVNERVRRAGDDLEIRADARHHNSIPVVDRAGVRYNKYVGVFLLRQNVIDPQRRFCILLRSELAAVYDKSEAAELFRGSEIRRRQIQTRQRHPLKVAQNDRTSKNTNTAGNSISLFFNYTPFRELLQVLTIRQIHRIL